MGRTGSGERVVHLSGVTPVLGPSCRAPILQLAALAAVAGKPVSYDLNYRHGELFSGRGKAQHLSRVALG